jgi:threonine dehydrogenase-like Zn-dependent dehydrogenase
MVGPWRRPQGVSYCGGASRSRSRASNSSATRVSLSSRAAVSTPLKKTRGHLGSDDHLVIIGAGGVGGSAVHIAPATVAGKVIVADIDAQKRAHARLMGAVATIDNAAPDAVKQVMEATGGGAAAAIDFVGSPRTMEFGVNILRKGGKLVMVGLYGGANPISTVLFVQDDDDPGLLRRHARRSSGTPHPRPGRQGPADPDRDAAGRPGERGTERLEERGEGARTGGATPSLGARARQ